MGLLDTTFRNLGESLINTFGAKVATLRTVSSTFTPATGLTTESVSDQDLSISPPSPVQLSRLASRLSLVDPTLVQDGDMVTYVAAKSLTTVPIANTTRLIFDSDTWEITGVGPVYSGDQVAVYELMLRR